MRNSLLTAQCMLLASEARGKAILGTPDGRRQELGQHLTPPETALLAVSLFDDHDHEALNCLDLGCGTGMLSSALISRYGRRLNRVDAYDIDDHMIQSYEYAVRGFVDGRTTSADVLNTSIDERYDLVIMNPPYGKMSARDPRHKNLPIATPNLYSSFMLTGLRCLADGGEMVAIVPRSWTNGSYFTDFRRYILSRYSLDAMHVYGSRSEVFSDTNVLQETMVVRFSRQIQTPMITVGLSDTKLDQPEYKAYDSTSLIVGSDMVVRTEPQKSICLGRTLKDAGFCPSTGKVVDFRSKDSIFFDKPNANDAVPLLYAANFRSGKLDHPKTDIGKPQWFLADDGRKMAQVLPAGHYVVVKRFTSKEERRRVVAYPLHSSEPVALENHLNFIHAGTPRRVVPLSSPSIAMGLAAWLNTSQVDEWFRGFSGSTQVNASDLRAMPCPDNQILHDIGLAWEPRKSQKLTDEICSEALCQKKC